MTNSVEVLKDDGVVKSRQKNRELGKKANADEHREMVGEQELEEEIEEMNQHNKT